MVYIFSYQHSKDSSKNLSLLCAPFYLAIHDVKVSCGKKPTFCISLYKLAILNKLKNLLLKIPDFLTISFNICETRLNEFLFRNTKRL